MIKNIFVKHETKDYSGGDMGRFKGNLIDKLEGFDNKKVLAKIESIILFIQSPPIWI